MCSMLGKEGIICVPSNVQRRIQKIQKEGAKSSPSPNENITFPDMQQTALWAYSWWKVTNVNVSEDRIKTQKKHFQSKIVVLVVE